MAITQFTNIKYSDALPIQLWLADCDTWNEQSPEGVKHKKFCLPVNCDDPQRIEFTDTLDDDTNFENITLPPLSEWKNRSTGSSPDWTTGSAPSASMPSSNIESEILYIDNYTFYPGFRYRITINLTASAISGIGFAIILLRTYTSDFTVIASALASYSPGTTSRSIEFTATAETAIFGISLRSTTLNGSHTVTINSRSALRNIPDAYQMTIVDENEAILQVVDLNVTTIVGVNNSVAYYYKSFAFSDYGICDQMVQIKIYKSTGTPDIEVLKSDGLDVKTSHPETVLITYSNHRNYAGVYYQSVSPDQEFSLRIPAIFYKQRFPQTQETLQLSSNRVVSLNSQMKIQQLLSTGKMPLYMHLKMTLVLAHQNITINDEAWVNEEGYQPVEPADTRDTLERYICWLTKKEYIVRNIL